MGFTLPYALYQRAALQTLIPVQLVSSPILSVHRRMSESSSPKHGRDASGDSDSDEAVKRHRVHVEKGASMDLVDMNAKAAKVRGGVL